MNKDIVLNKLRLLVNHLPLMDSKTQVYAISEANIMLDEYFAGGGEFISTRITDWKSPNKKLQSDSIEIGDGYWFCGKCHTIHAKRYDADHCCRRS